MPARLPVRVDKYLGGCVPSPLAQLRAACREGRVRLVAPNALDGSPVAFRIVLCPEELVFPGDQLMLDGVTVSPRGDREVLALHKPVGVTTTTRDPDGQADLSRWLSRMPPGVFPVGRLDRMTSGLLLCTNDGDLAFAVTSPAHHVEKRYRLTVDDRVEERDRRLERLCRGVVVPGEVGPLRAASVAVTSRSERRTELCLTLTQGRHRQLRKMCRGAGLRLIALQRVAVGNVGLGALAPGEHRALTSAEVEGLWALAGGRDRVKSRQLDALRARAVAARGRGAPDERLDAWLERNA